MLIWTPIMGQSTTCGVNVNKKTQRYPRRAKKLLMFTPILPLASSDIHMGFVTKWNMFGQQHRTLVKPSRYQTTIRGDHPVARMMTMTTRLTENFAHQARVSRPTNQPGNLTIAGHASHGNPVNHGQDVLNHLVIHRRHRFTTYFNSPAMRRLINSSRSSWQTPKLCSFSAAL